MISPFRLHFLSDNKPDTILILAEDAVNAIDIFYEFVELHNLIGYDFKFNHPLCFVENLYFQSADKLTNYGNI